MSTWTPLAGGFANYVGIENPLVTALREQLHAADYPKTFHVPIATYTAVEDSVHAWAVENETVICCGPNAGILFKGVELIPEGDQP